MRASAAKLKTVLMKYTFATIFVLLFLSSKAQNNIYELYKSDDSTALKLYFSFVIRDADLKNVNRIALYKHIEGRDEPMFIKEFYIKPFKEYYSISDNTVHKFIKTYFTTKFSLYRDEYGQISNLSYKIFFNNKDPENIIISKP